MMIQKRLIEKFNNLFSEINNIQAAIIIGSFGRGTQRGNSDIDYQIFVNDAFDNDIFYKEIQSVFKEELKHSIFLKNKNKWCFYLSDDYIVIEVFVCKELIELDKYFLGSEIFKPENAIIFDKTNSVFQYFQKILHHKKEQFSKSQKTKVEDLIIDFQNRFESCSNAHAKSDGYKFSVLFSHALNVTIRLIYLCQGESEYDYMPPNFLTNYGYKLNLGIEKLGTMDLRLANSNKRKLLDLFLEYLPCAIQKFEIKIDKHSIINFLEGVFARDFFWNFRDIAKFNSKIQKGIIYRSSALCSYEEPHLNKKLKKHNIANIIDLRANRELEKWDYSHRLKSCFKIIHAPMDPWSQSIEFQNTYNTGTHIEIAYQFFSIECKKSIKKVVETVIDSKEAVNIHCHAGKDRTGIVVTLFHLLSGASEDEIFLDYLASEMDSNKSYLKILLNIVEKTGGIEKYLESCKLSMMQVGRLKQKFID
ncbi:MAG: hypothetical protein DRQ57_08980 [Gammaproteobacteria bacterium]|nr:MAG: hypothetical protein DRQ57_08980 [Gammaproteobacteria bacterium]